MEKTEEEITTKIRSAIDKKLIEIRAFVDEELSHYIMLMIANKRSKSQFQKDLSLFLGDNTNTFTDWLWSFLNTMRISAKEKPPLKKKQKKTDTEDDSDVLNYNPDEQDNEVLEETLIRKAEVKSQIQKPTNTIRKTPVVEVQPIKHDQSLTKSLQRSAKVYPIQHVSRPSSTVVQIVRQVPNNNDEYDPTKPAVSGSIPSSIRITKRKYNCPASLQANKLLQRAVTDATKSVKPRKEVKESYKPTPIKILSSNQSENPVLIDCLSLSSDNANKTVQSECVTSHKAEGPILPEGFNFPLIQPQEPVLNEMPSSMNIDEPVSTRISKSAIDSILFREDPKESYSYHNHPLFLMQEPQEPKPRTIYLPSSPKLTDIGYSPEIAVLEPPGLEQEQSPHFIVTLDGVNLSSLVKKRRHSDIEDYEEIFSDVEDMELDDNSFMDEDPIPKKQKKSERCRYWPACKNNSCLYHHPSIPCKCFPDCRFGDKCLYIHPNCKFDALCTKKDCPFTHASKRKLQPFIGIPAAKIPVKVPAPKAVCKFYPRCTAKFCPFVHPKLCKYGTLCRTPNCIFTHFKVPTRNQLTWTADNL